jgi:S-(hydroxymethyl)glutathione dehydrogenase / alcohol dehydrogenase
MDMRGAVIDEVPGRPTIAEIELDEPGAGEVLVRTVACGVCHSDLSSINGSISMFTPPFVLGHEPAGIVEAVGPDVRHLRPGDHVVATLVGYCGHCAGCLGGEAMRCTGGSGASARAADAPRLRRGGEPIGQHCGLGGFADHLLVGHHNVVKVDEALPLDRACLLGCGVLTGAGAVWNTTPVRAGRTVVVIGCGGVGLAAIQAARIAYAKTVVAVDVSDSKLELARRCGATDVVNANDGDAVAEVVDITRGGAEYVFEAIGRPQTTQQAIAMTAPMGTCTIIGMMPPEAEIVVSGMDLMIGRTIRQSVMGSARPVVDIPILVDHALAGRLDLEVMIEGTRTLDELPAALDDLEAGQVLGRTVIAF